MKILIIEGSPNKKGSSKLLAKYFKIGAEEAGHTVSVFNGGSANIHPYLGCESCPKSGLCCKKDDMIILQRKILSSDMIVFVTPVYYYDMTAQLKIIIDRFYSFNESLTSKHMKSALIAASWDASMKSMEVLKNVYLKICECMNFENTGTILGAGCGSLVMTKDSKYPKEAYEFGKSL